MPNTNGLLSCRDVAATGEVDSNFFVREGDPLPSPLVIQSPNETQEAILSVDNDNGALTITSQAIVLNPNDNFTIVVGNATGGGAGLLVKPDDQVTGTGGISLFNGSDSSTPTYYTTFNASVTAGGLSAGNLQTFGYSSPGGSVVREITNFTVDGSQASIGDGSTVGGAVVSVNGSLGLSRVNDPIYNPPPSIFTLYGSFTGTMANEISATFPLIESGMYLLTTFIDTFGGTPPTQNLTGALLFGDPPHAATFVLQSINTINSASIINQVQTQAFLNLSNSTYEPNQRYKFIISGTPGQPDPGVGVGGTVILNLYKLF